MPELTRRRYLERPDCWHVYFGDVRVGTISRRSGQPHDEEPWEWICGFYSEPEPGEHTNGTGATFGQAREAFEAACRVFLAKRTEADFQHGAISVTGRPVSMRCGSGVNGCQRNKQTDKLSWNIAEWGRKL
jgi:hypothetical protein